MNLKNVLGNIEKKFSGKSIIIIRKNCYSKETTILFIKSNAIACYI